MKTYDDFAGLLLVGFIMGSVAPEISAWAGHTGVGGAVMGILGAAICLALSRRATS